MTFDKLQTGNDLRKKIKETKQIIENAEKQKCEWILFTFGNGSNRENVCQNPDIIKKVRDLLIIENKKLLKKLEEQFLNL